MKKKLAKLLVWTLVLSTLFSLPTARAAQSKRMRIGLAYGDDAKAACELRNVENTGYRMGYFDGEQNFVSLAWTGESDIQVLITQNLYLKSGGSYTYSSDNNKGAVGCYHIHLPQTYEDYDAALAAAEAVEGGFVAWIKGNYYVRVGSFTKKASAEEAAAACGVEGACLGETSGYGYSAVAAGTTRILFQYDADVGGESGAFGVLPGLEEGDTVTAFGGYKYRGGFRFERINGGESTVVNVVDLEDYIRGILPYEMSASWPLEALKAQAVCARSYSLYHSTRHKSSHFDLCTTTDCQVYRGVGSASANSDRAVAETAGQLARYNGKIVDAVYYSSNGGASEDAKNVWGSEIGYLKGKADPYEADIADTAGHYKWTKTYTAAELKTKLRNSNRLCDDIVGVTTTKSDVGNVIAITFLDAAGKSWTISRGDKIRSFLGTNSIRFTVETSGGKTASGYAVAGRSENADSLSELYAISGTGSVDALGESGYIITAAGVKALEPAVQAAPDSALTFSFKGTGWGHNVGLSQWGAYAMAKQGYTYDQILKFYYTGITIE